MKRLPPSSSVPPEATLVPSKAWEAVHAALDHLPGWEATRPQWHADERRWVVSAIYAGHLRRSEARPAVEGRGVSEAAALVGASHSPTGTG